MNKYIGHLTQLSGVEESRLVGGLGDGMRLLTVRNGKGLDFVISLDRAMDISRLSFKGDNFSYISPAGYVAPQYYDRVGSGFLKSFTAGFFTTCGLTAVGSPCTDLGEELPLHGTVSHIPAESFSYLTEGNTIKIRGTVRDAAPFSHKLLLTREYAVSTEKNEIILFDTVENIGSKTTPLEILYHCNMGYPLLSEKAVLTIPSEKVCPRNSHAAEGLDVWSRIEEPQRGYEEMCFYHELKGLAEVSLYNPDIGKGVKISYDTKELPYFTEWKMMGECEYVMGLEPGNCLPDGRDVMRERGILDFLKPGEKRSYTIKFEFLER